MLSKVIHLVWEKVQECQNWSCICDGYGGVHGELLRQPLPQDFPFRQFREALGNKGSDDSFLGIGLAKENSLTQYFPFLGGSCKDLVGKKELSPFLN